MTDAEAVATGEDSDTAGEAETEATPVDAATEEGPSRPKMR